MAFCRRFDVRQPSIFWIAFPFHEVVLFETRHDPGHRRRSHLFGAGEGTQREGPAEDDDGESGKAGSGKSAGVILLSQLSQEVDCRRMKLVGERLRVVVPGHASGTSLIKPTTFPCPSEMSAIQISRPPMRAMTWGSVMLLAPEDLMRACVSLMSLTS